MKTDKSNVRGGLCKPKANFSGSFRGCEGVEMGQNEAKSAVVLSGAESCN